MIATRIDSRKSPRVNVKMSCLVNIAAGRRRNSQNFPSAEIIKSKINRLAVKPDAEYPVENQS
jgi:hypothetical protein